MEYANFIKKLLSKSNSNMLGKLKINGIVAIDPTINFEHQKDKAIDIK